MIKKLLSPYLRGLIKEHIGYILFNIAILTLLIFFCFTNIDRISTNRNKLNSLTKEVNLLNQKLNTLNSLNYSNDDLKKYLTFLNTLIPNYEDYFSLIYSLEEVSRKTNFIINSYQINLKQSNKEKLKLTISGIGDRDNFINFLKNYTFSGGRLITSDKIELNSQIEKEIKIDVTFYNKKITMQNNDQSQLSLDAINDVGTLYKKVNFSLKDNSQNNQTNYLKKNNPF